MSQITDIIYFGKTGEFPKEETERQKYETIFDNGEYSKFNQEKTELA